MQINILSSPDEKIAQEIKAVEKVCQKNDRLNGRLFLDSSVNFSPDIKDLFLLYDNDQLASVISLFAPTREEAEITAFTLPEFRRKHYFQRLLAEAVKEARKFAVKDLLFVCEPQSKDGLAVIDRLKAKLDFTEYFLRYKVLNCAPDREKSSGLKLHQAQSKELDTIAGLRQEIFGNDYEDAKSIAARAFTDDKRTQYLAKLGGETIGLGVASFENGEVSINGLGMLKQYRGQGFGKELLLLIIEDLIKHGKDNITIEVDSSNDIAFRLYKKCGFQVEAEFDYYRLALADFRGD